MAETHTATHRRNENDNNEKRTEIEQRQDDEQRRLDEVMDERDERNRRFREYAATRGEYSVRSFVRSANEAVLSLFPSSWTRPAPVLRTWFDLLDRMIGFQRAMWDEMLQVGREDARRTVRRNERIDWDEDWEKERDRIGR